MPMRTVGLVLALAFVAACASGPQYHPPAEEQVVAYSAPLEIPQLAAGAYYSPLLVGEIQKAQSAPISEAEQMTTNTLAVGTSAVPLFASPGSDLSSSLRTNI